MTIAGDVKSHDIARCCIPCQFRTTATSPSHKTSMGQTLTVYKVPGRSCVSCGQTCIDSKRHRVQVVPPLRYRTAPDRIVDGQSKRHKSHCCCVCGKWYCGIDKYEYMERWGKKTHPLGHMYAVWKCYLLSPGTRSRAGS